MGNAAKNRQFNVLQQSLETLGFVLKQNDAKTLELFQKLLPKLSKIKNRSLFIEREAYQSLPQKERKLIEGIETKELLKRSDVVVVLGGDGTILRCTRFLLQSGAWKSTALLGVNAGRVGFLAAIQSKDAFTRLPSLLSTPGALTIENHSCLALRVEHPSKRTKEFHSLNDVVISKGSLSRIFELEVSIDGHFLSSYRSDGLILSPPTGSTAYNLAAGGSIIEPNIPAIQITPIAPQYFSNKPILVSDRHEIGIRLVRHSTDVHITVDGQVGLRFEDEHRLKISRSGKSLNFLYPSDLIERHFFISLRHKLNWGLAQK